LRFAYAPYRSCSLSAVVFLSSDLHFTSRVLGAAVAVGVDCKLAPSPTQLAGAIAANCRLVFVDLGMAGVDLPAAVATVRRASPQAKIVAFGPHVDEALLASAQAAGCDLVLPRSQFHKQYVELIREAARRSKDEGLRT
jgi:DNA-binding NarL/FixJ family response regulator